MGPVIYDVTYTEARSRLTTAFRFILAIPHLLFASVWGYAAELVAVIQWFVILFTGRRNEGMWSFQRSYLGYNARVSSYAGLLFDEYPNFGSMWQNEPVAFGTDYRPDANRLTNALRLIWIIPALIVAIVVTIGQCFVLLVSWFAIVFTGRQSRGMFDFILRVNRFVFDLSAYSMLMTDDYPHYDGSGPTSTLPPGDREAGRPLGTYTGAPLPPPAGPPAG